MWNNKKTVIACAVTFVAAVILTIGVMSVMTGTKGKVLVSKEDYAQAKYYVQKYSKLESLYKLLEKDYYKELNEDDLLTGTYKGLFAGTGDPYTAYFTEEEFKMLVDSLDSNFFGIGVTIFLNDDNDCEIASVMEGEPAEKAGVLGGDVIVSVDGESCKGETPTQVASRVRGEKNTKVKIQVRRDGNLLDFEIKRAEITDVSVISEVLEDNIGYIGITSFQKDTAEEFREELSKMENAKVDGLIIDLRANGGGLVDQAAEVADMLMDEGMIVYMQNRQGQKKEYNSKPGRTALKYVVLVDEATASASEIMTTGIQKNKEGIIVGTTTYGKGIAQNSWPLKDGTGVDITIYEYFAEDGTVINKKGIKPDVVVEFEESDIKDGRIVNDRQLDEAIKVLKKSLGK